jgi:hypothetical protein
VASANLFSIVETAKANGVEPHAYLSLLFAQLPYAKKVEDFEALLPCSGGHHRGAWKHSRIGSKRPEEILRHFRTPSARLALVATDRGLLGPWRTETHTLPSFHPSERGVERPLWRIRKRACERLLIADISRTRRSSELPESTLTGRTPASAKGQSNKVNHPFQPESRLTDIRSRDVPRY